MFEQRSWFWIHEERSCETQECTRPQRIGGLCAFCFHGAEAHVKATALLIDQAASCTRLEIS
jgi:hypothetical protein